MINHPLTDDILINRFPEHARKFNSYTFDYTADGMRAAADWQLERDAEYFTEYLVSIFGLDPEVAQVRATHFKEAMRPQQQQQPMKDNND